MIKFDNFTIQKSKRLRIARSLSGLTRENFSKKHDVSVCPDGEVLCHLRLGSKSKRPVTFADTQTYDDSN